ncbi:hypothetical protein ERO13_A13G061000v2 [Gossypium hirsutum]|nr:hypothetical protein ERO13_A13G061000v2 [Gossypium hirsutum]KAG4165139.1 hypothetical protein ERO13_A13G061000v2 [Gossypium hirsutum]KAG4165140.1 hypothetical protein ERO13_A13G061000v2 [Gossypium hirsutum]
MNLSTLFQDKFGYSWRVARVEAVVEMACGSRKLGLPMLKIYLFFGPFKLYARADWASYKGNGG